MQDLIRLVHGNTSGIKRLVREFRVFWLKQSQKTLSDTSSSSQEDKGNDSLVVTEKESAVDQSFNDVTETEDKLSRNDENKDTENVKEEGYGCCISKRQLELKILSIAVRERREGFKKICWYVHENILSQFSMSDIKLPNSWVYFSITPAKNIVSNVNKSINIVKDDCAAEVNELERQEEQEIPVKPQAKDQRSIKDFALSKEELAKKNEIQAAKAVEISNLKTNMLDTPKENKLNIAVENSNPKLVVSDTPKCIKAINKSLQSSTTKSIVSDTTKEVKKSNNQRSIMEFAKKPKCGKDMLYVTSESKLKMAKCTVGLEEINTNLYNTSNNKNGSRSHESDYILITDSEDSAMSPFTIMGYMTDTPVTDARNPSISSTLVNCDKGIETMADKDNEAMEEKCIEAMDEAMDVDSIPKLQNESLSTTEKVNVDSITIME
ncbi:unnamed protein product [Lymnaea stagnalis]|uniref:Chromatin assembly factor 1 subunit p150 C-terminal domain-containing protein n=1 Tax=Lymnaea stagnalis TaxID=6523 RepID=A0AAV2IHH9_LYMST